ncbi:MAG: DUF2318 domain-containing protein [Clostridiales bacterium]|nr:DUF2318 domain-containing protein [Clostridiales bacterium]
MSKKGKTAAVKFVIMITVFAMTVLSFAGCSGRQNNSENSAQVIKSGTYLEISISEISDTVSFYPVEVDNTEMEIIAVLDSSGNIRTAFNTCQVCYSSGRGYYEQSGNKLVCQNCGNQFSVDEIGIESGGCNPYPILEDDKETTDDTVKISYDFLSESASLFANWKISF